MLLFDTGYVRFFLHILFKGVYHACLGIETNITAYKAINKHHHYFTWSLYSVLNNCIDSLIEGNAKRVVAESPLGPLIMDLLL